ncbi:MAG TPA: aldo/keto reductase [Tepidisphaeraceae bacterium]|nr:aldo/keto reductase [Tepidisphaeraceae bacterium]
MYEAKSSRYDTRNWFRRCGKSGLFLPAISLGCWHNFGGVGTDAGHHEEEFSFHANCREMLFAAFDVGITHFDLANNYGPPPGSAEERVGRILKDELARYRDELIISTKAGYRMWPGPYGEWGSRKYLLASLDASLKRLKLDYVDIFYSHRPDPDTPLEETMGALEQAVKSGKAIYAGISSYSGAMTADALMTCQQNGFAKPIIHQPSYNMFNRWIEGDLLSVTQRFGLGVIAFCPLAQGLLTNKYLSGIPSNSRAATTTGFLKPSSVTADAVSKAKKLNEVAQARGQTLAQMALSWVLRSPMVTTALIGASRAEQIIENAAAASKTDFTKEELTQIDAILKS